MIVSLAVPVIAGGGVAATLVVAVLCACKRTKKVAPEAAYHSDRDLASENAPAQATLASHVSLPAAPGTVVEAENLPVAAKQVRTVKELREYAAAIGASANDIDDARDGKDPRAALQDLIRATEQQKAQKPAQEQADRDQLQFKTAKELREHAAALGVSQHAIEEARDAHDPCAALITLIHQQRSPAMYGP